MPRRDEQHRHEQVLGEALRSRLEHMQQHLENEIMMSREEFRKGFQEALPEIRNLRGAVASLAAMLTAYHEQVDKLASTATDMEEFREGLAEIQTVPKQLAADIAAAVAANPLPGDPQPAQP